MVRAREDDRDPFDVLDEEIGWDRLVASREEIAALGDLATQDPLSLATQRYAQLRRFAPAFLDAFEFDAPAAGHDLQAAVTLLRELNRTGKRTLPDIVPMPFPSQHWRAVILHNANPTNKPCDDPWLALVGRDHRQALEMPSGIGRAAAVAAAERAAGCRASRRLCTETRGPR